MSTIRKNKLNRLGAKTFHLNCSIWRLLRFNVHKNGFKHANVKYCRNPSKVQTMKLTVHLQFSKLLKTESPTFERKSGQSPVPLYSQPKKILPELA